MENEDLEYLVELSEAQEIPEQIVIESYLDHLMHKQHRGINEDEASPKLTAKDRYLNMFPESERKRAAAYWDAGIPLAYVVLD